MQEQTLLIVDDEALVIEVIREVAESVGLRTLTASNATEAMKIIDIVRPDIVLCDLNLPDLDGHKLCANIRCREPYPRLVLMTGQIDALNGPCDLVLMKPFGVGELKTVLNSAMATA